MHNIRVLSYDVGVENDIRLTTNKKKNHYVFRIVKMYNKTMIIILPRVYEIDFPVLGTRARS